jgi:hypothetical protein
MWVHDVEAKAIPIFDVLSAELESKNGTMDGHSS